MLKSSGVGKEHGRVVLSWQYVTTVRIGFCARSISSDGHSNYERLRNRVESHTRQCDCIRGARTKHRLIAYLIIKYNIRFRLTIVNVICNVLSPDLSSGLIQAILCSRPLFCFVRELLCANLTRSVKYTRIMYYTNAKRVGWRFCFFFLLSH